MTESSAPRAGVLLEHLERDLGEFTATKGAMNAETGLDFSLLQFDDRPDSGVTATVTFGVSVHVLGGRDGSERREELIVLLRRSFDQEALEIAANIGQYLLDEHIALVEGETISMPPQRGSRLDRLVATSPVPLPGRFARCNQFEPPVDLVWLLPFAESEHHIVAEHGSRDLLRWIGERRESPYDLRRTPVV